VIEVLRFRYFAIALLAVACMSLAGCDRVWTLTFNDVYDLAGWHLGPYDANDEYRIDENGLMLDAVAAGAPFSFSGDIVLTVVFDLFANSANPIKDLSFVLSSTPQHLYFAFNNLCVPGEELFYFVDNSYADRIEYPGAVPNIRYTGHNTLVLQKRAGRFKVELNGAVLLDEPFSLYDAEFSTPRIGAISSDGTGYVLFKIIRVQYSGEAIPAAV